MGIIVDTGRLRNGRPVYALTALGKTIANHEDLLECLREGALAKHEAAHDGGRLGFAFFLNGRRHEQDQCGRIPTQRGRRFKSCQSRQFTGTSR